MGLRFDGRRIVVQAEDDAGHFLVAEGDEDAGSDGRRRLHRARR